MHNERLSTQLKKFCALYNLYCNKYLCNSGWERKCVFIHVTINNSSRKIISFIHLHICAHYKEHESKAYYVHISTNEPFVAAAADKSTHNNRTRIKRQQSTATNSASLQQSR